MTLNDTHAGNEEINVKSNDESRISSSDCVQQNRDASTDMSRNTPYNDADNISYGCILDGDTTGEGIYDIISAEEDDNYIDIL